jgi:hypothetical protein
MATQRALRTNIGLQIDDEGNIQVENAQLRRMMKQYVGKSIEHFLNNPPEDEKLRSQIALQLLKFLMPTAKPEKEEDKEVTKPPQTIKIGGKIIHF